ncbi:MAG TPA: HAD-IIIA family hydrolase [Thermoanaerobaculia bacterium]|nr:HAD-IIIA family hydrolase [Thermoanaerobaculia bacterium]
MKRAIFLDRDGVVDDLVYYPSHEEWESPRNVRDLHMREEAIEPLRKAGDAGWLLFLITNQPSYAKGKSPLEDLQEVHERVLEQLSGRGVKITDSYVCYHHPDSKIAGFGPCQCRKPSPQFLREAAERYDIDLVSSWMVGDQDSDVVTGINAGCRTALLKYEHSSGKRGSAKPDLVCADLAELVRNVVDGSRPSH